MFVIYYIFHIFAKILCYVYLYAWQVSTCGLSHKHQNNTEGISIYIPRKAYICEIIIAQPAGSEDITYIRYGNVMMMPEFTCTIAPPKHLAHFCAYGSYNVVMENEKYIYFLFLIYTKRW